MNELFFAVCDGNVLGVSVKRERTKSQESSNCYFYFIILSLFPMQQSYETFPPPFVVRSNNWSNLASKCHNGEKETPLVCNRHSMFRSNKITALSSCLRSMTRSLNNGKTPFPSSCTADRDELQIRR
mmetsp:Transcript_22228/g.32321  ORF Transcript_22228/g.32321 Transcript_22228/m.32321 type:complete len:127 (+) Transcript_22228:739-1119(+)